MKSKSNSSITIVAILAVVLFGLMLVLNPDMDAFSKYYQKRAEAQAGQATSGILGNIVSGVAKGLAGATAGTLFTRSNKGLFSTFTMGSADDPVERYLGILGFFIKTK